LIGNELVEIGVGEHAARALLAVADAHIAERARLDVAVKRAQRTAELRRRLGSRAQPIGRADSGSRLSLWGKQERL
jgi:hypothetical protein